MIDTASNLGPLSSPYTISVDTSAPTQTVTISNAIDDVSNFLGAIAHNGTTNDTAPELLGTLSAPLIAGEVVDIIRDGTLIGQAIVTGTNWTFTDAALADGTSYNYQAQIRDAAGNTGTLSSVFTLNIDTSPALQTVTVTDVLDDVVPNTSNISHNGITNDTAPEIIGTLSTALAANELLNVLRDGAVIGQATVTGTSWRYTDSGLSDATSYHYTAQIIDAASNLGSLSNVYTINIDTASPTQTSTIDDIQDNVSPTTGSVANNGTSNDTTPVLSGTLTVALGAGEVLNVLRDGTIVGQATVTGTSWSFPDSGLTDGNSYSYTTQVEDSAGNLGVASASYTINIDTSNPAQAISITNINDDTAPGIGNIIDGGVSNDLAPDIIGTLGGALSAGEVVNVYRDATLIGQAIVTGLTWSFADVGLTHANSYNYTARIEDLAGNLGGLSNSYNLNIDTVAPTQTVTISSIVDDVAPITGTIISGGISNDLAPTINGALSAALNAGEVVNILRFGVIVGQATVTGTTWTYADSGLIDGNNYVYTAQVMDAASNLGSASTSYNINIDTSAPTQTLTIDNIQDDISPITGSISNGGSTNDTAPVLNGTLSAILATNEVLNILRDGIVIGQANVTTTSWSYNDTALTDGSTYSYTSQVVDSAGNQGSASSAFVISIDTTNPTQTVTINDVQDNVPAQTGTVADGASTNDLAPQIIGTLNSNLLVGEVLNVLRDGFVIGQASVVGTNWSYADSALTDLTSYTYTAQVIDSAGNTGVVSNSYIINTDTVATSAPILISVQDNVGVLQGNIANGGTTDDNTPTMVVTIPADATAGDILIIYRGATQIGSVVIGASDIGSNVNITPTSSLADGTYTLSSAIVDAAGNVSARSASSTLTVDTYDENAAFISAVSFGAARWAGSGGTHITNPNVSVSGLPAGSVVRLYVSSHGQVGSKTVSVDGGSGSFSVSSDYTMSSGDRVYATVTYSGTTRFVHTGHEFLNPGNHDISFSSPLILDLDNDGIETINVADGVLFDITNNGERDKTGWVAPDDGLLVLDINQDGVINDASELFGEHMLKDDGTTAANGFDALGQYDENNDGVIDEKDQIFSQLEIWQDINSDGISQDEELFSIKELGITQLSLFSEQTNENNNGNIEGLQGYYLDEHGNKQSFADIWFSYETDSSSAVVSENSILDSADNLNAINEVLEKLTLNGIDISPLESFDYLSYYNEQQSVPLADIVTSDKETDANDVMNIFRYIFTHYASNEEAIEESVGLSDINNQASTLYLKNLALFATQQHEIIDQLIHDLAYPT